MTYKETIEEIWNNWIKDTQDRKKYTIRNKDYTPLNAKKEEFFGRNIPAHWEHFRLGVLRKDGYCENWELIEMSNAREQEDKQ